MRVAEAAVAAVQEHGAVAWLDEVEQHGLAVLVEHLGPDGNAQHKGLARGAGAVAPGPAASVLRPEMLLIAVVDQGVEIGRGLEDHVAAPSAVAAIGAAELDELLAPETRRARAAVAAAEVDLALVEELHGRGLSGLGLGHEKRGNGGHSPFSIL